MPVDTYTFPSFSSNAIPLPSPFLTSSTLLPDGDGILTLCSAVYTPYLYSSLGVMTFSEATRYARARQKRAATHHARRPFLALSLGDETDRLLGSTPFGCVQAMLTSLVSPDLW